VPDDFELNRFWLASPIPSGEVGSPILVKGFTTWSPPRRERRDLDAIDTPVGKPVQLRNEAAPGQTDPDFRHCR